MCKSCSNTFYARREKNKRLTVKNFVIRRKKEIELHKANKKRTRTKKKEQAKKPEPVYPSPEVIKEMKKKRGTEDRWPLDEPPDVKNPAMNEDGGPLKHLFKRADENKKAMKEKQKQRQKNTAERSGNAMDAVQDTELEAEEYELIQVLEDALDMFDREMQPSVDMLRRIFDSEQFNGILEQACADTHARDAVLRNLKTRTKELENLEKYMQKLLGHFTQKTEPDEPPLGKTMVLVAAPKGTSEADLRALATFVLGIDANVYKLEPKDKKELPWFDNKLDPRKRQSKTD